MEDENFYSYCYGINYTYTSACEFYNILKEQYLSNALDYFTYNFLFTNSGLIDWWGWDNPNPISKLYKLLFYDEDYATFRRMLKVKDSYFGYAFRTFFPNTYRVVKSKIPLVIRLASFCFPTSKSNNYNFINHDIMVRLSDNLTLYDNNDIENFFNLLKNKYVPRLQKNRMKVKKICIQNFVERLQATKQVFNINEVKSIDFYGLFDDTRYTNIDDYMRIDNLLRKPEFDIEAFKQLEEEVAYDGNYNKLYYFNFCVYASLTSTISIWQNGQSGLTPLSFLLPSQRFKMNMLNILFFEVTFKDGEKRLYLNKEDGYYKEVKLNTPITYKDMCTALSTIYNKDSLNLNASLEDILYIQDFESFLEELKYFYNLVINMSTLYKKFTYIADIKGVVLYDDI